MVILEQLILIQLTSVGDVAEFVFKRVLTRKLVYSVNLLNVKKERHSIVRCKSGLKNGNNRDQSNGRNTWEMIKINQIMSNFY